MNKKRHWEDIYASRSPLEVSWYQAEPRLSLELIARARVTPQDPIIDIGGGASLLVDCLLDRAHTKLAVLDLSANAFAHARTRLGSRASQVDWYEQDVTQFSPPHRFRVWHDRAVFHFLTDPTDREGYIAALRQAVAPGGHVIMAAFALGGPTQCSGLDIVQYDAEKMGAALGPEFRLVEQASEVHITPAGREQEFGFYLFTREA